MRGSRLIGVFGLLVVIALPAQAQGIAALRQAVAQSGGRVIITLKSSSGASLRAPGSPPVSDAEMASISARVTRQYGVRVARSVSFVGVISATVDDTALASLVSDTNVDHVEADVPVRIMSSGTTHVMRVPRTRADAIPWGITDVGAPQAWAAGLTGAGVKVGIIDSGIDYTHPDLSVTGGYAWTFSGSSSNYMDNVSSCGGHGTHVAGTVAALQNGIGVVGVAPGVTLYALKVFEDDGTGCEAWLSSQLSAIQWAVTNHLDVISMSIGNTDSYALDNAIASALSNNVTVVAAAGNDNGGPIVYPAAISGVIAVAALNSDNTVASYSNAGPQMWVAAPGTNVTSTLPGGGYGDKSGTSMATPHVTGVVALLKQAHPTWTPAQIRSQIESTAHDLGTAGFDNATGWGLVQAPTSGGTQTPTTLALSPSSRFASVQQGSSAPGDQATVTLGGTNGSTATWTATRKHSWITLTTASGTGSGTVAWSRSTSGLTAGTYVDTISVASTGATGSPASVIDTLVITPVIVPVTIAVSPSARSTSVQQGGSAPGSSATVTLTGTNAATTSWSASRKSSWLTLTTSSGTGSGSVAWTRNASSLAVGTYVDTITVTAPGATGSPAVVFDTLHVTPIPVTLAVSPGGLHATVQQGSTAGNGQASITLTGTAGPSTAWSATHRGSWLSFTTGSGTGSGTMAWTRNASSLGVGTYVDTIAVTATGATGSPAKVYDTLQVTAAPVPVTIAVSPAARSVTVQQGQSAPGDNVTVTLSGTNAGSTLWSATHRSSWLSFTTSSGTGSGTAAWTRSVASLAAGTYVDTISIAAAGAVNSPVTVYDSVKVTAAPVPVTIALASHGSGVSVQQGSAAPAGTVAVSLSGTNAASTTWSTAHRSSWLAFTTSSGTGSGTLAWNRNASALSVGTYVDTLTVSASGATNSPVSFYDTLRVTAAPVAIALSLTPTSRNVSAQAGAIVPNDYTAISLSGTGGSSATWSATHHSTWLSFVYGGSGIGSGSFIWSINTAGLAPGTYVDTVTVTAPAATNSPARLYDTLQILAAPVPVTIAAAPWSRSATVQAGTPAPADNVAITVAGTGASTTTWSTSHRAAWLTITSGASTGSGLLTWTRNTSALAAGTYVDTLTVSAAGAINSPIQVYDTVRITTAPVPIAIAVNPVSHGAAITAGGTAPDGSADVVITGTGSAGIPWSATSDAAWVSVSTPSGTGTGTLAWQRRATGLGVGAHVDTITVTASGAAGSPVLLIDTLRINAAPIPLTVAVNPSVRSATQAQGTSTSDQALVTISGDGAGQASWHASSHQSWVTFDPSSGIGSGTVRWTRSTASLAAGTFVDTVTVSIDGTTAAAVLLDTLHVTPAPGTIALAPAGRKLRSLHFAGAASLVALTIDSALVQGTGDDGSGNWNAAVSSERLQLMTAAGTVNAHVVWSRPAEPLDNGLYVDTVTVSLVSDPSVQAQFVDSLEVVSVTSPTPDAAVTDLFDAASLSSDQRAVLDAQGNDNGRYDLGDFLAWVKRNHIQLSPAVAIKVRQVPVRPAHPAEISTAAATPVPLHQDR